MGDREVQMEAGTELQGEVPAEGKRLDRSDEVSQRASGSKLREAFEQGKKKSGRGRKKAASKSNIRQLKKQDGNANAAENKDGDSLPNQAQPAEAGVALLIQALFKPQDVSPKVLEQLVPRLVQSPLISTLVDAKVKEKADALVNQAKTEVSENIKELLDSKDEQINELARQLGEYQIGNVPNQDQPAPPVNNTPAMPYGDDMRQVMREMIREEFAQERSRMMGGAQPAQNQTMLQYRPPSGINRQAPITSWTNPPYMGNR